MSRTYAFITLAFVIFGALFGVLAIAYDSWAFLCFQQACYVVVIGGLFSDLWARW
jgi:hypothetical protein